MKIKNEEEEEEARNDVDSFSFIFIRPTKYNKKKAEIIFYSSYFPHKADHRCIENKLIA